MPATISPVLVALALSAPGSFDAIFSGKTLRLDYYHSGSAAAEHIGFDEVRLEGEWPGSRMHCLDDSDLGKYFFVVTDLATRREVYSRGFSSIYGEWETTTEARRGVWRSFHESQRFPEPRLPCQVTIRKRGDDGAFRDIDSLVVDPHSRFVNRAPIVASGTPWILFENGPPAVKVDLLVLGDGYTAAEAAKFHADVERLSGILFSTEPFRRQRQAFNVRALDLPAAASGISDPRRKLWNETPLGLSFNAFDLDRYVLTLKNRALREAAAQVPYDAVVILANTRKYGGGGIFNLWATCSADTSEVGYVFVHEIGHSFAGLADEYYTSQVAYQDFTPPGVEPWEPNITALLDPSRLKWQALRDDGVPVPSPWNQAAFDAASKSFEERRRTLERARATDAEMEALLADAKKATAPLLRAEPRFGNVGAFEGAGYQAKGLYRPQVDCLMFSRSGREFCRVCDHAIARAISLYTE